MGNHETRRRGKSVDASGSNVEEAVASALERLNCTREEVEVTVLRESRSGLLGIGARDAIVRVTELLDVEEPDVDGDEDVSMAEGVDRGDVQAGIQGDRDEPVAPVAAEEPAPADEEFVAEPEEAPAAEERDEFVVRDGAIQNLTDEQQELLEISHEMLVELLTRMRVIADVQAYWAPPETPRDEPTLKMDIVGDDLGILIGRHGTTLRALQYIMRLMVGHQIEDYVNLVIDVDGYKKRRAEKLRNLAQKKADQVRQRGAPVHLKPMSPYERRIVHIALREDPDVTTESTGKGSNRRVGIYPSK